MPRLELRDFMKYSFLSQPTFSPDGEHLAFIVSICDEVKDDYDTGIYLLSCSNNAVSRLTQGGEEKTFCWLDNNTIIFPAARSKTAKDKLALGDDFTEFQSITITGGEAAPYMTVNLKVKGLVPIDANRFALTAVWRNQKTEKDYLVADEIPFRHNGAGFHNGERSRLYIYYRNDGSLVPVTDEWQNVEFVSVRGEEVLFTAMHFYKENRMGLTTGIYTFDLKTYNLRTLLPEDKFRIRMCDFLEEDIGFSGSDMMSWGPNENPHFFRLTRDGVVTMIASNQASACNSVGSDCRMGHGDDIVLDNGNFYFLSTEGGDAVLKQIDKAGQQRYITSEKGTVDSFDVYQGKIYAVLMRGNRLQELYKITDGQETQITSLNEWVHNTCTLSTPESISFISQGNDLEGWVIKPVGFETGKSYPAILNIHGGHKCAYGPVFYHEMQLWANEGYFVFFCNPRGSDGGGNTFAEIIDKYGEIDFDDLMVFTDKVLALNPQIDKKRLAVTGGSYGGYMTNWIIGHTDRFACACSQRSISNFISEFGTADTGYYFPLKQFVNSNPWDHMERYWFHSPLAYANRCKTPTLFIHSEEDYRCPLQEGIQMFTALKYHGVDSRICMFKAENHELSRSGKPSHRVRRLEEITGWFNKYLMKQEED